MRGAAVVVKVCSLILIALVSLGAGAMLLWGGLDRTSLGDAPMIHLLGVLTLMLAPAPSVVAFEVERRRRSRARRLAGRIGETTSENPSACAERGRRAADDRSGVAPAPRRRTCDALPQSARGAIIHEGQDRRALASAGASATRSPARATRATSRSCDRRR